MALATRCPNCQALFRVVADQLKLRGGLVRCGACRHVFDAISTLNYIDDATIAAGPTPSSAADESVESAQHADAAGDPFDAAAAGDVPSAPAAFASLRSDEMADPTTPEADDAPVETDGRKFGAAIADSGEPQADDDASSAPATSTEEQRTETPSSSDLAQPAPVDRVDATASAAEPVADAESSDVPEPQEHPAEAAGATDEGDAEAVHPRLAGDADEPVAPAAGEPAFLQSKETPRGFSIVFGGGAFVLALLLALQLAVVFRSEILVRAPQALAALSQACRLFNCTVTWPARSELLAVVGSELQAIAGTNVLELTTTVRNRASHRQPLPAIELTLTDATNRTVVRKVFTPADYLAAGDDGAERLAAGVEAGGETTIRLAFEVQGQNATGYGFLVYPFHL